MADSTSTNPNSAIIYTPREAVLHSADFLKRRNTVITVRGTAVLVDKELGRVDIAHNGAKLIVRLPPEAPAGIVIVDDGDHDAKENISSSQEEEKIVKSGIIVDVTGTLRKEQRRTFLQATSLSLPLP
ncbi:expressed unknown protein [Seminavis robusta]|uniref:Uncharacterized protein n=1 Tax=Seminavis robusta TaxID=568900 RepID=A0A9N8DL58_9STRA|nr:expressed unknown protein [Seminavis robusta]|eukprot:Sro218_g090070.1 n/a (128) ;mRNA; r:37871-38254